MCRLHALCLREQSGLHRSRYISPVTQVQEEIFARRSAPPPYLEAMRTSRNFEEVQREILAARQSTLEAGGRQNQSVGDDQHTVSSDDDDDLIDISMDDPGNPTDVERDSSDVQISLATGMSAQWRRSRPKQHGNRSSVESDDVELLSDAASASNESVIISVNMEDHNKVTDTTTMTTPCVAQTSQTDERSFSDGDSYHSDVVTLDTLVMVERHSLDDESLGESDDERPLI